MSTTSMQKSPIQYRNVFHENALYLGVTFKKSGARYTHAVLVQSFRRTEAAVELFFLAH